MKTEIITLNEKRNVTLTCYLQNVGGDYEYVTARPAVLIIPGGAYAMCSDREADPVAFQYLKAGYDAFILRYTVTQHIEPMWPRPLEDYENAMQTILRNAGAWHVIPEKIAVVGFSAGGHLAAMAAVKAQHRPAAAIIGYGLLENVEMITPVTNAPDVPPLVDHQTPPFFLFASRTDTVVPVSNTLHMAEALEKHGIMFEMHITEYGPHGYSTADPSVQLSTTNMPRRIADWVEQSIGWLADILGTFGQNGMTSPAVETRVNGDDDDFLSITCTVGRILGNPAAVEKLAPLIGEMKEKITPYMPGLTFEDMMQICARRTLKDLLTERNIEVDRLDEIDALLKRIPNT